MGYLPEKQLEQNDVFGSDGIDSIPSIDKYRSESTPKYLSICFTDLFAAINSLRVGMSIPKKHGEIIGGEETRK